MHFTFLTNYFWMGRPPHLPLTGLANRLARANVRHVDPIDSCRRSCVHRGICRVACDRIHHRNLPLSLYLKNSNRVAKIKRQAFRRRRNKKQKKKQLYWFMHSFKGSSINYREGGRESEKYAGVAIFGIRPLCNVHIKHISHYVQLGRNNKSKEDENDEKEEKNLWPQNITSNLEFLFTSLTNRRMT